MRASFLFWRVAAHPAPGAHAPQPGAGDAAHVHWSARE